ncbi:HlyD family efflux transporter periplasmic adaptor subunit [Sporosalibacterium faouarense]|uniref:HlyD family efflux transporter periplasmic adaptor subunit n=1 Tax=Sporosalibacterium faouarense TaxID=516123 RepID=UPI00192B2BD6|nr:HlyD family efflux transporter periplasmic adaptor subunit [Sporosalibacterium faouarense]
MAIENKRKKKFGKKKAKIFLVIIIMVYLVFRIIPTLHASKLETYTATKGEIEIVKEFDGIVFKNETVYKATANGQITFFANEGDRIGVNHKIAEISLNDDLEQKKEELKEIETEIENLQDNNISKNIFEEDINKNQEYIDSLIIEIQKSILKEDYKRVSEIRKILDERLDKQSTMTGENTYNAASIDLLEQRREKLLEEISTSNIEYISEKSGVISYDIDNLEMVYVPQKLGELYPKNFNKIDKDVMKQFSGKKVNSGEQIYKIIDNYEWFLAIKIIDEEVIDSLDEENHVYIRLDDSGEELKAKIYKINKENSQAVLILSLNKKLYDFYQMRYTPVQIILNRYEGLKIPSKSIVEKYGIKGVYIKGAGGITKFRGINVLGSDKDYTIVEEREGYNNSIIKTTNNGETVNIVALAIYDEIIVNGGKVKEGEIIN